MAERLRVAILGASADRAKFGNKAVRAHLRQGCEVFPINPRGGEIEGLPVARSLAEVPAPLDRVSVYLPPAALLPLLPQIAAHGCRELWLNPGSESPEVVSAAAALGLHVVQACSIVAIGEHPGDYEA